MRFTPFVLIPLICVLSACASDDVVQPATDHTAVASSRSSSAPIATKPVYASYRDGVLASGMPVALFFHSAADPFSIKTEESLAELYRTSPPAVSTYRVNMDVDTVLARRYIVIVPDTLVLLDADGVKIDNKLHPSLDDIRSFLIRFPSPTL